MAMREAGHRAVLFFSVQHQEIDKVSVTAEIDPEYAKLLKRATESGVEVLAYQCLVTADELIIHHSIPFNLSHRFIRSLNQSQYGYRFFRLPLNPADAFPNSKRELGNIGSC